MVTADVSMVWHEVLRPEPVVLDAVENRARVVLARLRVETGRNQDQRVVIAAKGRRLAYFARRSGQLFEELWVTRIKPDQFGR